MSRTPPPVGAASDATSSSLLERVKTQDAQAALRAEPPNAVLSIEGFDGFVTSTAAPIASGWSDKLPGGSCAPREKPTPYTAQR